MPPLHALLGDSASQQRNDIRDKPAQPPCAANPVHYINARDYIAANPKVVYVSDTLAPVGREKYEKGAAIAWTLARHLAIHNDGNSGNVAVGSHLWLNNRMDAEKAKLHADMMPYPSYLKDLAGYRWKRRRDDTVYDAIGFWQMKFRAQEAHQKKDPLLTHSENDLSDLVQKDRTSPAVHEALKRMRLRHNVGLTVDLQKDLVTYLYQPPETESVSDSSRTGMQLNVCMDIDTATISATTNPIAADFHSDKDRADFLAYCKHAPDELRRFERDSPVPTLSDEGIGAAENIARSSDIQMLTHENDIVASNRLTLGMKALIEESVKNFLPLSFVELRLAEAVNTLFEHDPKEIFFQGNLDNWYQSEAPTLAIDERLKLAEAYLDCGEKYPAVRLQEINAVRELVRTLYNEDMDSSPAKTDDFNNKYGDFIASYWRAKKEHLLFVADLQNSTYMMSRWNANKTNASVDRAVQTINGTVQPDLYETVISANILDIGTAQRLDDEMKAGVALSGLESSSRLAPIANTLFNNNIDVFVLASRLLAMRDEFRNQLQEDDGTSIPYADMNMRQKALVSLYQTATTMVKSFVNSRTYAPFVRRWELKNEMPDADFNTVLEDLLPQSVDLVKTGTWTPELDSASYPTGDPLDEDDDILGNEELMRQAMREVTGWLRPAEV